MSHPTRYEVVAEIEGEEGRRLIGYTARRSSHGLRVMMMRDCVMNRWEGKELTRLSPAHRGYEISEEGGRVLARIFFSGRTMREAASAELVRL